MNCISVQINI